MLSVLSREYLKQLRAEGGKPTDEEIIQIYELGKQASQVLTTPGLRTMITPLTKMTRREAEKRSVFTEYSYRFSQGPGIREDTIW